MMRYDYRLSIPVSNMPIVAAKIISEIDDELCNIEWRWDIIRVRVNEFRGLYFTVAIIDIYRDHIEIAANKEKLSEVKEFIQNIIDEVETDDECEKRGNGNTVTVEVPDKIADCDKLSIVKKIAEKFGSLHKVYVEYVDEKFELKTCIITPKEKIELTFREGTITITGSKETIQETLNMI